jgi:hypothetical protein
VVSKERGSPKARPSARLTKQQILNIVQAASRIAWGPFYISHSVDSFWSVYDTRVGKGLLVSDLSFRKAAQYAFDSMQDEAYQVETGHPRV